MEGVNYAINYVWDVPEIMILAQNLVSGTCLDVNHFQKIVKSSNMLLRHANTSVNVVEGLEENRKVNHAINNFRDVSATMILAQNRVVWHVSGRKLLSRDS